VVLDKREDRMMVRESSLSTQRQSSRKIEKDVKSSLPEVDADALGGIMEVTLVRRGSAAV
jgi:hypothetical protein